MTVSPGMNSIAIPWARVSAAKPPWPRTPLTNYQSLLKKDKTSAAAARGLSKVYIPRVGYPDRFRSSSAGTAAFAAARIELRTRVLTAEDKRQCTIWLL